MFSGCSDLDHHHVSTSFDRMDARAHAAPCADGADANIVLAMGAGVTHA